MANALELAKPLTGRTVLVAMLSFFAVIFAVNGVFLFLALSSNSGVVANEPYRKGLKYNERIAADERQVALGWTSEIALDAGNGRLVALLGDRDGKAISGLIATAIVGRAASDREDVAATLTETAPGRYETKIQIVNSGSYVANLEVSDPSTADHVVVYRARRRLWLKP
jgi:nitrogen fixation protein FixH